MSEETIIHCPICGSIEFVNDDNNWMQENYNKRIQAAEQRGREALAEALRHELAKFVNSMAALIVTNEHDEAFDPKYTQGTINGARHALLKLSQLCPPTAREEGEK